MKPRANTFYCVFKPLAAYFLLCFSCIAFADAALSAKEIMAAVLERDDGVTEYSHQTLISCKYQIRDKKRRCAEKPRIKKMESFRKDFGPANKDKKSISMLLDPPGERGIGFLQYDYDDPNHDADQWMYLSALGKVKRIISGNDDEPKQGSFFGSEFSYEDIEVPHLDDYHYKLLDELKLNGRACWVIEITPVPKRARKSHYSKTINWIDKERLLNIKSIK